MSSNGHKKQKESPSLIPLIAAKEQAFSSMLSDAERASKEIIQRAEREAARILTDTQKKAAEETEAAFAKNHEEISEEMSGILKEGEEAARKLRTSLADLIPKAAETVTEFILPGGSSSS